MEAEEEENSFNNIIIVTPSISCLFQKHIKELSKMPFHSIHTKAIIVTNFSTMCSRLIVVCVPNRNTSVYSIMAFSVYVCKRL